MFEFLMFEVQLAEQANLCAYPVGKVRKMLGAESIPSNNVILLFPTVSSSSSLVCTQDLCNASQSQLWLLKW